MSYIFVLLGLFFIFLTQKLMAKQLAIFIHRLGGNKKTFITFWSAIFLPGTILHEVSHFLVASATGVHTGKVEVLPEFIEDAVEGQENKGVHLGYVQVAKMNPIQGFLVGFAPLITGSVILAWLSSLISVAFQLKEYGKLALFVYIFFTVANSFFPSWEDIKHALPFVILLILIFLGTWFLGFRFTFTQNNFALDISKILGDTLFISGCLNCVILLTFLLINRLGRRRLIS